MQAAAEPQPAGGGADEAMATEAPPPPVVDNVPLTAAVLGPDELRCIFAALLVVEDTGETLGRCAADAPAPACAQTLAADASAVHGWRGVTRRCMTVAVEWRDTLRSTPRCVGRCPCVF